MPCARSTSRAAAAGSWGGITAVPINRSGSADGPVGDPVVPHLVRRDREVDVVEAAERLTESAVEDGDVDAFGVHHLEAFLGVPAARVEVVGIAQRVAELLVAVHARVAEPGEPHRDRDVVLDQHLLGADAVVVAHPRSALSHRRGKFALPQVDRLAHVAIGVDHHVRASARELPHRCSPRNRTFCRPTQRRRDAGVNDVLVIGSEQTGRPSTNTQRAYAADLRDFAAWCAEHGSPERARRAPADVAAYLRDRAEALAPATVARRLAAIVAAHHRLGFDVTAGRPRGARTRSRASSGTTGRGADRPGRSTPSRWRG